MIHLCPDELTVATPAATTILCWLRAGWVWVQAILWRCPHVEMIRERRDDGGLDVVCSRCGYRTHLLRRTR